MSDFCKACQTMFAGTTAFDAHRVGTYSPMTRRCMTKSDMEHATKRDGTPVFNLSGAKVALWRSEEQRESLRKLSAR